MSLESSFLLHSQGYHSPFSASYPTSEQGSSLGTQAERRIWEGPWRWNQRAGTQGQFKRTGGAAAIGFRGTVAWPHYPGLLGPSVLSTEANCSPSPSKEPTKGTGLIPEHVRFRVHLRKPFLAPHLRWEKMDCMCVPGCAGLREVG